MGHSTASGRTNGQPHRPEPHPGAQAADLQREIERNGHAEYRGYDIDGQVYGEGTYSVQYDGDDIMLDSVSEAMRTIDELIDYENRSNFSSNSWGNEVIRRNNRSR